MENMTLMNLSQITDDFIVKESKVTLTFELNTEKRK